MLTPYGQLQGVWLSNFRTVTMKTGDEKQGFVCIFLKNNFLLLQFQEKIKIMLMQANILRNTVKWGERERGTCKY